MKKTKLIGFALLMAGFVMLAQSCSTSKKCGCGADINGRYNKHRSMF